MRKLLIALTVLSALTPTVARGDDCGAMVIAVGAEGSAVAYVTRDPSPEVYPLVVSVYLESNGLAALQRGGYDPFGNPDYCWEEGQPDTLVY